MQPELKLTSKVYWSGRTQALHTIMHPYIQNEMRPQENKRMLLEKRAGAAYTGCTDRPSSEVKFLTEIENDEAAVM